jgi:predicted O-linked N-acetylglucosamine transferase (SPINDLY family)
VDIAAMGGALHFDQFDLLTRQAALALAAGQYKDAAAAYEELVAVQPDVISHRWRLGLAYALQGFEAEAQMVWSLSLAEIESEQPEQHEASAQELLQLLLSTAAEQQTQAAYLTAWRLRQQIRELDPTHLENLIQLVQLSVHLEQHPGEVLVQTGLTELLKTAAISPEQAETLSNQLLELLRLLLDQAYEHLAVYDFAEASALHIRDRAALEQVIQSRVHHIAYVMKYVVPACRLAEVVRQCNPSSLWALRFLSIFYRFNHQYAQSIQTAQRYVELCQTRTERLVGNALLLQALVRAGSDWQSAFAVYEQQRALLHDWLHDEPTPTNINADEPPDITLFTVSFCNFPYFVDAPQQIRPLQNQVAQRYQQQLVAHFNQQHGAGAWQRRFAPRRPTSSRKVLRIGYICRFFQRHSVGWLARWLLHYHDREQFDIYTYHIQRAEVDAFGQRWFVDPVTRACCFSGDDLGVAQAIYDDEIDILVDLDSLTVDQTCGVMALKPAPIQVSWLGLDATGLPTIDYFIADPYVLPESAQNYYQERIWRLPHTYIAVDGFEVGIPSLRRADLEIPENAVIYFSSQTALKRHPDTVRLQMRILKAVPHSYFLIKGFGDQQGVQALFEAIATEEGVSPERLRFLPSAPSEETHRADLAIADVVLDTYPYNGATTTLETLWMGIPLVTRVGQQFAARNSYTMMINAGITEGIAWTDQEYIDWGIRLGQDVELRQQISWQLHQSRQTSPLWNAKQFAQDMERAYLEMWQQYCE